MTAPNLEALSALVFTMRKKGMAVPPDLELPLLEFEAAKRGIGTHRTFESFIEAMNGSLLQYRHVRRLIDVGQRIVDGLLRNVIVMLPPRYFKTEIFGKLLTSYFLLRHPTCFVGLTSYAADLAWETSEGSQRYYMRANGRVLESVQAKRLWATPQGGRLWALGMGAGILGKGFNLGVVDDPIKPEDARSPTYRNRFQRWWPNTWLSRREPNAQIVFVMQRLGPEDPVDFLFRREVGEKTEHAPLHWHVVVMDEIHSEEELGRWSGPKGLPPTCTLEPDERKVGEVLAERRFDRKAVEASQRSAGPLTTAAQRQQRPMQAKGDFWRLDDFTEYDTLPETAFNGGWDWDTSLTADEANSASAGIKSFRGPAPRDRPDEFNVYIEDLTWEWCEFPRLVKMIQERQGPHYVEAKASGKSAVQSLATYNIKAVEVPVVGDKLARAARVQPAVSNGRVYVNKLVIHKLLYGERQGLLRITAEHLQAGGEGLDINDAFVQALHRQLGIGKKRVRFG